MIRNIKLEKNKMSRILYAFSFDQGYIYEIEKPGQTKAEKYQWYLLRNDRPEPLSFKSSTETTREFNDGTKLSLSHCTLERKGECYKAAPCSGWDMKQIKHSSKIF